MDSLSIVASTAEAAFATDGKGNIVAWNKAAEELLGYDEPQVRGKRCYQVLRGTDLFGNRFCDINCPLVNMARRHEGVRHFQLDLCKATCETFRADVSVILVSGRPRSRFTIIHLLRPHERERDTERLHWITLQKASGLPSSRGSKSVPLTPREIEVFRLLADGTNTREIAKLLSMSPTTARNHVQHILRKLNVHSRLEAVSFAHRLHLI